MSQLRAQRDCEVAIIGTGPYGLSLAAHLAAAGVDFRIFGKPMELWRQHMPERMMLKSNGFASNLSAPDGKASRLKSFCRQTGRPYGDLNVPVPLQTFIDYADWFRARHVPNLEEKMVAGLEKQLESTEAAHEAQRRELMAGIAEREANLGRLTGSLDGQREQIAQLERDKADLAAQLQGRHDRLETITAVLTELEGKARQALDLAKTVPH